MSAGPSIPMNKILSAAKGNPDLLDVLQSVAQGSSTLQAVTGTSVAAPGGITGVNPTTPNATHQAARVPAQATGYVSVLGGNYVVQLVNPGAQSPISQLQSAQQATASTSLTPLQPVTPIYHQIRVSTSPAFNVNSNTQTFGGGTGSTQVYWVLTGLGTGTWFVQFRSSYDGQNFNTWKNANNGAGLGGLVDQVTLEKTGNAEWALFTLPGKLIVGIGAGIVADKETLDLAQELYSSGLVAIASPNGYTPRGNSAYGVTLSDLDLDVPSTGLAGITGVPDFPVVARMEYGEAHAAPSYWPGNASVFGIAFDPTNQAVDLHTGPSGAVWAVLTLPGGAKIAIGQGKNNDGEQLWMPPEVPWMSWARSMAISTFTDATDNGLTPHGYLSNQISAAGVLSAKYSDEASTWSTAANWFAIAWMQGVPVQTVGGFPWIIIQLQGGHAMAIGIGQQANYGSNVVLPAGYSVDKMLSICTPAGFEPGYGHHFQGIQECAMVQLSPVLIYQDDSGNIWPGRCNWAVAAWI